MNITPRDPKKKCFCRKCAECFFYRYWNLLDEKGNSIPTLVCSIEVLFQNIPKLIGSIDGCQEATNETRNAVFNYGEASVTTLEAISEHLDPDVKLIKEQKEDAELNL